MCVYEELVVNVLGDEAVLVYLLGGKTRGNCFRRQEKSVRSQVEFEMTYSASISVVCVQTGSAMGSSPGSTRLFTVPYLF